MHVIGEETARRLDVVPAQLRVAGDAPFEHQFTLLTTQGEDRRGDPLWLEPLGQASRGHDEGAEIWPCIASLIEICKIGRVDPQAYFTAALTKLINLWPASRIDELMTWAWAARHATRKLAV